MSNKGYKNSKPTTPIGGGPRGNIANSLAMPVEKAKNFKGSLKNLINRLSRYKMQLLLVVLFAIASTIFTIMAPKILSKAINKLTDGVMSKMVISELSDVQKKFKNSMNSQVSSSSSVKLTPQTLLAVREFMLLPQIDTLKTSEEKANVCKKIFDLSKNMPSQMSGQKMQLTQDQINSAISAIRETNGQIDYTYIGNILLILIAIYILSSSFQFVMQFLMSSITQKTVYDLRKSVNEKLDKLPLRYFDSRTHGEILSRVTNDIDTISTTLQQSLTQLITSIISIIGYIIMMFSISATLTLVVICTLPIYALGVVVLTKISQRHFKAQQKTLGMLSGHIEEMYTGHKIVKAFGYEEDSVKKFANINNELYNAGWKAQFVSGIMFPVMNFISNLGYVAISIIGGIWMTKSLINLGDITAFIQYSNSFSMPIMQTANVANIIQSTVACAERVFEVLYEEEESKEADEKGVISNLNGDVEFDDVCFSYDKSVSLIEDMNIDVKKGNVVAIVGPTGAGKTTLVNLLMRFYDIDKGKILIDKHNIYSMSRVELRSMIGMVLQDTWLFNGTIRDNIAYGLKNATDKQIIDAAKIAQADSFIRTLPKGYDTVLNEEATNISQGQKQLLTIARAVLANSQIIILDEATSNVDTRTEVLIQNAMQKLMKGKTSFIIAHRLSTIKNAELILVMKHGRIIEQGRHDELIKKGGFYADLYNSQFAGIAI